MKKFFKYLLIMVLPLLIIDSVLILNYGVENFANLFIAEDMNSQYVALLRWLQEVLHGNENLFYSFTKGIGGNMFSTFAYYLSSPLNIILLFFSNQSLIIAICLIIHLKFSLSSLTMYIFLKNKYKNTNYIYLLMFSVIYALSGAAINYYSNTMWIDIVYLTPLVIMGLEKIIKGGKSYLYIIALAIAIMSNFYISYMLCLFCIIYYIYETVIKYKKSDKKIIINNTKRFILYSLLAALLSCVILVPTIYDMASNMYRYELSRPIFYFDIDALSMIFAKLFIGGMSVETMYSHNEANIYISIFSLLLLITYFFDKKNTKKEKVATASVIMLFVLSITFNAFNLIWHGFSFPNGYSYRFVFFITFFLITISAKELLSITKYNKLDKSLSKYLVTVTFLAVLVVYNKYTYLTSTKIIISLIFLCIYIILYIYRNKKFKLKDTFILVLVIIELAINTNYTFITSRLVNNWYKTKYDLNMLKDISLEGEMCNFLVNESINRVDIEQTLTYNDGMLCGKSSISTALTTNHKQYYKFLEKVGYAVTYSTIKADFNNAPFIDSILGVKYMTRVNSNYQPYYNFNSKVILNDKINDEALSFIQYENPYALNLGYVIKQNKKIEFDKNPFKYQNELAKNMSGLDINLFEKVKIEEIETTTPNSQTLTFSAENKKYYAYNYVPVPINTIEYGYFDIYPSRKHYYMAGGTGIVGIEDHVVNENFTISYVTDDEFKKYIDIQLYSFNEENFEKIIGKLKETQLKVTKREKNVLEGNININKNNSLLMITVPYEDGWTILVDGKKVEYEELYDTFIGIRLDKGEHEIKMIFHSPGIIIGSILTFSGVIILFVLMYNDKNFKNKYIKNLKKYIHKKETNTKSKKNDK